MRMRIANRIAAWLLALAVSVTIAGSFSAVQAQSAAEVALVEMLRRGGYNIYFRHVATDWSQADRVAQRDDWLDCDPSRMRQLSDEGRADAAAVGEAIRGLGIPVGEVLASPYCRTMETARLMQLGPVRASTDVMNLRSAEYFGGREAILTSARRLLSTPPPEGTNRVIVAHGNVAREATPVYPGEGEGVVFEPLGVGFRLVGRVTPEDWRRIDAGMD
jgi:hypothetical protein